MKKLFLLLALALSLFANQSKSAIQAQILEKIFLNIEMGKEIVLWSDNKTLIQEFEKTGHFKTTDDCREATILIVEEKKNLPKKICNKAVFVLDYDLLRKIPQSFGSMFWKKGRPNIVLIEPRAKKQRITISKELEMYNEEKIW
ncbi:hypothetical protein FCU45_08420 [Sulfurimonas crateris]|uniref:Uncharacterized protein n=1 Tax=Sulfurimonas crateris TaxID=2574727 RepID=A0A4U2Z428_9BACT|nr:hypothetical protein [Sulfurimonas crateris]TKI68976.1 hypothetical protein FCU45_08420 [Sulfurimonas crateris]